MAKRTERIYVLESPPGPSIVLRGDPSLEEVTAFAEEHNRRASAGEISGWHEHNDPRLTTPIAAASVVSIKSYKTELDWLRGVAGKLVTYDRSLGNS